MLLFPSFRSFYSFISVHYNDIINVKICERKEDCQNRNSFHHKHNTLYLWGGRGSKEKGDFYLVSFFLEINFLKVTVLPAIVPTQTLTFF